MPAKMDQQFEARCKALAAWNAHLKAETAELERLSLELQTEVYRLAGIAKPPLRLVGREA